MGGANNNQVSTFDYLMTLILKASSTKGAFFYRFYLNNMFRFKAEKK